MGQGVQAVGVGLLALVLPNVRHTPALVEHVPAHDAGVIVIPPQDLRPVGHVAAGGGFVKAHPVGPVQEPGILGLLVLAAAVEAHLLCGLDIHPEGVARRRGHEPIGPIALIQDQLLRAFPAVQVKASVPTFHPAQAEIGLHPILRLAVHGEAGLQVKQRGMLRRPQQAAVKMLAQDGLAVAEIQHRVAPGLAQGHGGVGAVPPLQGGGEIHPAGQGASLGHRVLHPHLSALRIRRIAQQRDGGGRHALQPHALPDAGGGGVEDACAPARPALLAPGDAVGELLVADLHPQALGALSEAGGDIRREGRLAALVGDHMPAVDVHAGPVIHRPKVQQHPLALPSLGHVKFPLVGDAASGQGLADAAGRALVHIGHADLSLLALGQAVAPQAVQQRVALPVELGPGVFHGDHGCSSFMWMAISVFMPSAGAMPSRRHSSGATSRVERGSSPEKSPPCTWSETMYSGTSR